MFLCREERAEEEECVTDKEESMRESFEGDGRD